MLRGIEQGKFRLGYDLVVGYVRLKDAMSGPKIQLDRGGAASFEAALSQDAAANPAREELRQMLSRVVSPEGLKDSAAYRNAQRLDRISANETLGPITRFTDEAQERLLANGMYIGILTGASPVDLAHMGFSIKATDELDTMNDSQGHPALHEPSLRTQFAIDPGNFCIGSAGLPKGERMRLFREHADRIRAEYPGAKAIVGSTSDVVEAATAYADFSRIETGVADRLFHWTDNSGFTYTVAGTQSGGSMPLFVGVDNGGEHLPIRITLKTYNEAALSQVEEFFGRDWGRDEARSMYAAASGVPYSKRGVFSEQVGIGTLIVPETVQTRVR